ncbi:CDP-alcohol phosphatidyltransferase-domain-containing protein [Cladorrhinum sp. PSN332]|nr:CDP-alcohol phosphatidyltransferase-domain-containing protein [Cladorrhinum sp. PSN332]
MLGLSLRITAAARCGPAAAGLMTGTVGASRCLSGRTTAAIMSPTIMRLAPIAERRKRPAAGVLLPTRLFSASPSGREHKQSTPSPKQSLLSKTLSATTGNPPLTKRENIYTLPNLLTVSRIILSPFVGYAILHDYHALALSLFAYAGITDLLDGWIARKWNLQTVVGTIIDPMADKMLMTVLVVALTMKSALPLWLAVIILGRDVGLAISALYFRWISLPPPKTMTRFWDFSLPSAEVKPTLISKWNTFLQLGLMGLTAVAPVVTAIDFGTALSTLQYVVATTTIWSGASYVFSKDAVKILTKPEAKTGEKKKEEETGGKKKQ